MMKYLKYFYAQIKRYLRLAVGVLPTAMLLFVCLVFAGYHLIYRGPLSTRQNKYQVGIVGDMDQSYLGFGVSAVQTLDPTRFMVDFIPLEEEEAQKALREGRLISYVTIPEEFLDSIIYGRNDVPITYVLTEGQSGIEGYLMQELSGIASRLVTSSQGAIYAMQDLAVAKGETGELGSWTDELNLKLIEFVLNRTKLAETRETGLADGMLIQQYYFCTVLLLFCFLFGISSAGIFLTRNGKLARWMKLRGIGAFGQVVCEYLPYFGLMLASVVIPLMILGRATEDFAFLGLKIYTKELIQGMCLLTLMISAMHFMLYELFRNPVAGLLVQFLVAVGMGYVSGFLYPASFFPEKLSELGRILPTGVSLDLLSRLLLQGKSAASTGGVLLYFVIFLGTAALFRAMWIRKEE